MIRERRNPAPVGRKFITLFTGFYASQVVQDFFYQQYCWFQNIISGNYQEIQSSPQQNMLIPRICTANGYYVTL